MTPGDYDVSVEIFLSDHPGKEPTVVKRTWRVSRAADLQAFARELGIKLLHAIGQRFEAVRLEADDRFFIYSIYDRARQFFGVIALQVGQMSDFRNMLALGFIRD